MANIRLSPSGRDVSVATTEESLVADLATLALVPSESGTDLVWVDSLLCYFHRNRFSTVASDGITVIPAIGFERDSAVIVVRIRDDNLRADACGCSRKCDEII